jgi:demethylmenaquinone methyltransferase/2-methoxy-6-polyprenyl-1,4-benzoquinol methylase
VTAAPAPEPDALRAYYAARAREYEAIYALPERQGQLAQMRETVGAFATDRRVLEVACGTGYWTAVLSRTARSVHAIDATDEMLALARAKALPAAVVTFAIADAYRLDRTEGAFDAAFAGFWWSHVRRADRARFLRGLNARLARPARVMLIDNRYVHGSSTPVSRADDGGNTYQQRRLSDGSMHEVLKNFTSAEELTRELEGAGGGRAIVTETMHFWVATYDLGEPDG